MTNKPEPGPIAKVIAFLFVLVGGIILFHLFSSTATSVISSESKPAKIKTQPDGYIGQSIRDGKFSFIVKSIDCGSKTISDSISTETALGKFCIVRLSIKNIGKVSNIVDVSGQLLLDSSGVKYDPQSSAGNTLPGNDNFDSTNLNPGLSVSGAIVFDIPKTTTPVAIELHDGFLSGGKQVSLQRQK
jgi:hypothetical protein